MDMELERLRNALLEEANLARVAQVEFGVQNAHLYERDELVEICVAVEDRQRWL